MKIQNKLNLIKTAIAVGKVVLTGKPAKILKNTEQGVRITELAIELGKQFKKDVKSK
jgi:hypothetical protein